METLTDYVKWMGNLDFDQSPLRAADAMILCVISYFDLSPVFGDGRKSVPVSDCVQMIEEGRARLIITGGDLGNLALFDAAVRTKRFGSLIMSDYTDISQTEPPLQFSAVTFTHRDSFSFIAFRGTDSSLAGWKENFMISFTKTRAQQLAEIYAADRISRGGNWYIAGHSKGGNLALYAACRLSDEELARVLHVYILDGPGLCPEVMDTELIRRVDPVTTCIIPEFDVIGKLFDPGITDTRIVKSFRDGLLQHSLPSWLIDHGELATAEKNTSRSLRLNEVMDSWIENRPPEERAIFIDELFEALDKAGVTDFSRMTLESLADTMLTLRNASETTRATLADLDHEAQAFGLAEESVGRVHVRESQPPGESVNQAPHEERRLSTAGKLRPQVRDARGYGRHAVARQFSRLRRQHPPHPFQVRVVEDASVEETSIVAHGLRRPDDLAPVQQDVVSLRHKAFHADGVEYLAEEFRDRSPGIRHERDVDHSLVMEDGPAAGAAAVDAKPVGRQGCGVHLLLGDLVGPDDHGRGVPPDAHDVPGRGRIE